MKGLFLIAPLLISQMVFGKMDSLTVDSKISDVTVFFDGAQISRQVNTKLKKGRCVLLIDNLSRELDPHSIQISKVQHCKILSVKHQMKLQNESKKFPEEVAIQSNIDAQELKIKSNQNKLNVFEIEEKILLENSQISKKEEGSTAMRIKEAADFYRARLNEISQQKLNISTEIRDAGKRIQELYAQLNEFRSKARKNYSQVCVTLECESDVISDFALSYYVNSAGWTPTYDFRVDDISKPFGIVYSANVFQSSGEDWSAVKLKLSTNNPSMSSEFPVLEPWYLDRNYRNPAPFKRGEGIIKAALQDKASKEAIPFANLVLYKDDQQVMLATTNMDGEAMMKPIPSGYYKLRASYVGYSSQEVTGIWVEEGRTCYVTLGLTANSVKLDEVEVVAYQRPLIDPDARSGQTVTREDYQNLATKDVSSVAARTEGIYQSDDERLNIRGGRAKNGTYFLDGNKNPEDVYFNSNSLKATPLNMEYLIDSPTTINSDGADNSIKIKETSAAANYVYRTAPKLEPASFLTAEIPNWSQLNLLSGSANIYLDGTFIGQTSIDVNDLKDTLNVSLGRDKDFVVTRTGNKLLNDRRVMGSVTKETVGWDISVKNNKGTKVKMIIKDQFPLSERKSIEVEKLEYAGASVDEKTGFITWEIQLEPGEKKTVTYKYAVKYSK